MSIEEQEFSQNEEYETATHEGEDSSATDSDDLDDEARAARDNREHKVRIGIYDVAGWKVEIQLARKSTLNRIRSVAAARFKQGPRDVNLELDGELLTEERSRPLMQLGDEVTLQWFKEHRLAVLLKKKGLKDLNAVGTYGRHVLHYAALDRDYDMMHDAVSRRAFKLSLINEADVFMDTPLMLASMRGDDDIMQLLMDRNASINCTNLYGRTPIMLAAEHGHAKVVLQLLEANASLKASPASRVGRNIPNALHLARLNGQDGCTMTITTFIQRIEMQRKNDLIEQEVQQAREVIIKKELEEQWEKDD